MAFPSYIFTDPCNALDCLVSILCSYVLQFFYLFHPKLTTGVAMTYNQRLLAISSGIDAVLTLMKVKSDACSPELQPQLALQPDHPVSIPINVPGMEQCQARIVLKLVSESPQQRY